jgi:hypothetical protein
MKRRKKLLFDGKLIVDLVAATRNLYCLGSDGLLFFLGMNRPLQRHHPVLRDDFDIVTIRGKRLVRDQFLPDLFGKHPVGRGAGLLVGCLTVGLVVG